MHAQNTHQLQNVRCVEEWVGHVVDHEAAYDKVTQVLAPYVHLHAGKVWNDQGIHARNREEVATDNV